MKRRWSIVDSSLHQRAQLVPRGKKQSMRRTSGVLVVAALAAALFAPTASSQSSDRPRLLPLNREVSGLTYRQWDVVWGRTQAVTPVGAKQSLAVTRSGRRCGVQVGRVRLLPVSFGGLLTAHCTIPAGTFLVFPVTGYLASAERPQALLAEVRAAFAAIVRARLTVDGRVVQPPGHVVTTPAYRVNLPARNGLGISAGPEWLLSRDYFAILSPLAVGTHTVRTLGVIDPPDQPRFSIGMTYRISVRATGPPDVTG